MRKINIANKCAFLLGPITVIIGSRIFNMKRGETKTVELSEGEHTVRVERYLNSGEIDLIVYDHDIDLVVKQSTPMYYYFVLYGIIMLPFIFNLLSIKNRLILYIGLAVLVLTSFHAGIFKQKKYFTISAISHNNP